MFASRRTVRQARLLRELSLELGLVPLAPPTRPDQNSRDEAILAAIIATPRSDTPEPEPRRGSALRRSGVLVAALAAIAGVAVIAVQVLHVAAPASAGSTPAMLDFAIPAQAVVTGDAPQARDDLLDLARVAASSPRTDGEVHYVESRRWLWEATAEAGSDQAVIVPTVVRSWTGADGSVRIDEDRDPPLDVQGRLAEPPVWIGPGQASDEFPPGTRDPAELDALSRDPEVLSSQLLRPLASMGCDANEAAAAGCLTTAITELNQSWDLPPDLASALWLALASEPAARSLGSVTDRAGRQVRAIAVEPLPDLPYTRVTVLLIDPSTGQLAGTETIDLSWPEADITTPTVTGFTSYTTRTHVPALGATPNDQ